MAPRPLSGCTPDGFRVSPTIPRKVRVTDRGKGPRDLGGVVGNRTRALPSVLPRFSFPDRESVPGPLDSEHPLNVKDWESKD